VVIQASRGFLLIVWTRYGSARKVSRTSLISSLVGKLLTVFVLPYLYVPLAQYLIFVCLI
jgi:hypothetical protein